MENSPVTIFDYKNNPVFSDYGELIEKSHKYFSNFGLTVNESKIYIFLIVYGKKIASDIIKTLKISRGEVYHVLTSLQNKGIIVASFSHPIQYSAIEISQGISFLQKIKNQELRELESSQKAILELWNQIPNNLNQENIGAEDQFKILEGKNQVYSKIHDMISKSKLECNVIVNAKESVNFFHKDIIESLKKSKTKIKLLSKLDTNQSHFLQSLDNKQIKKLSDSISDNLCFVSVDKKEILMYIKTPKIQNQHLSALWTDSSSIVFSNNLLFEHLWENSNFYNLEYSLNKNDLI